MNRVVVFLLLGLFFGQGINAADKTVVSGEWRLLASIQPLALMARDILGDSGRVETLLPLNASPHHFALRVSDMERLDSAQLVIWIGPELELPLTKALAGVPGDRILTLTDLESLQWPLTASPDRDRRHLDPHIWLNPRNGMVMAEAIAARLAQLRPEAAPAIRRRAERLIGQLTQLDLETTRRLAGLGDRGFITYHDGYVHFVQAYGLQQLGYLTKVPDRRPGARHLYQLRQRATGASCLLMDLAYRDGHGAKVAAQWGLEVVTLEPIGRSGDTYLQMLNRVAEAFATCLGSGMEAGE